MDIILKRKEKHKSLSYQNLQNKLSFWDPRYGSAITIFGITKVDGNINKVVELIGACAQVICLNNAKNNFINRPVKQIIPNKWEHIFSDSDIIPFFRYNSILWSNFNENRLKI